MILAPLLVSAVIGCTSAFGPPSGWPANAGNQTLKVGPLWFTGVLSYAQALPSAQPDGWYFAKTPTALRAGHRVVLRVERRDVGWARFAYGQIDKVAAVTLRACAASPTSLTWTGWAGGLVVHRPGCVHFTAAVDGGPPRKLNLALGRACT
jgi:hypothetical protein